MKAIRAALGASALAALIATVALTVMNLVAYAGRSADFIGAMIGFLALAFFATALVACTLGMLWRAYAQSRGWTGIHFYWPAGAAVGIAPPLFLMLAPMIEDGARSPVDRARLLSFFLTLTLGALLGGLTAAFAWLIRRPDRDAPNPPTSAP